MASFKCMGFTRKFESRAAQPPTDVRDAFAGYAGRAAHMSADQLRRFLVEEQGESAATVADAEWIVKALRSRHRSSVPAHPGIGFDDFFHYLFSDDLNPSIGSQVHQDMNCPLSHYYIYTSHNSYLTGNQLSSDCSDVPIINALRRGVRVIELDMWPNSTKDNVDILHGRTLTSPVEMIKCLRSIKEFAFHSSPYPVVITLEDHLTPDLQAKVAEMVIQTFGDILYYPESDSLDELHSPEALKNRVIISTKPPKEYLESKKGGKGSNDEACKTDVADLKALSISDDKDKHEQNADDQDEEESDDDDVDDDGVRRNAAPEYRHIITIHAGKPKGSLRQALKVDPCKVRRLSLSEEQLEKAAESHGPDLVRFTQKNILRVYPKGTRFNSSNYNPLLGWIHGAQMVAFNMQGHGKSLWLMQGLFRANGGCGYVKKPDYMMNIGPNGEVFNPEASLPVKTTLKVKIYMGDGWSMDFEQTHFDAYSPPDFYAKIKLVGAPADTQKKKTKIIKDDWTPLWDEEFSFPLTLPELALLRIEVREYDMSAKDAFAGQTCLPIWELKQGIRTVPLYDRKGKRYRSVRLLMRFRFV
ncbi:hypothetical protein Cni_G27454 [Canna indica]|uniref:Phosphoinositide phospholipase C n=1 Tax=Canna indica TaxID=4628 RepID=A0AAQ3L0V1_9LILI|nr:hypothetical protein Cni_G27454 [Canna indica]